MDGKLFTACGMLEGNRQGMKRQPVQIKACSKESIMLSNPIIDVTDEGVGDMAKMAPDLVQPTCLGRRLD